ncbi:MAG: phosphopantothenoylcysteine decarboxylase [Oligoflexales bacterium]|nr:phosphopantothenoylcysteine decarboxylase [Oligoflexales bacterium]
MERKKVLLGISSSIAAYKSCDLIRMFVDRGYDVFPIVTENAKQLVTPLTLETLANNPVYSDTFLSHDRKISHISLKEDAAILLIAPATANIIGKFAHGIADDLLSTTFLSVTCPILIAPAMNPSMWQNPALQDNVLVLKERGIKFIGPSEGSVVSGEKGIGRMAQIEDIFDSAVTILEGK